jgi:hypothetical protein
MKKYYLCISRKEKKVRFWNQRFKIGRVYRLDYVPETVNDMYKMVYRDGYSYYVDKYAFIPMRTVWAGIALFLVLFLAMVGESLIDILLKWIML